MVRGPLCVALHLRSRSDCRCRRLGLLLLVPSRPKAPPKNNSRLAARGNIAKTTERRTKYPCNAPPSLMGISLSWTTPARQLDRLAIIIEEEDGKAAPVRRRLPDRRWLRTGTLTPPSAALGHGSSTLPVAPSPGEPAPGNFLPFDIKNRDVAPAIWQRPDPGTSVRAGPGCPADCPA
jgi:hypothetical protein